MVENITAEQLRDVLDSGEDVVLFDNRPRESFEDWHIAGAYNCPWDPDWDMDLDRFESKLEEFGLALEKDDPVYAICAVGESSAAFAAGLAEHGYDLVNVEDGMEGWSRVYDVVDVPTESDDMDLLQIQRRAKGCLSYVVGSQRAGEAAVIDPSRHVDTYREVAENRGYDITHVFDTHIHADHLTGGRALADEVDATYHLGHRVEERGMERAYDPLRRNEVVSLGDVDVKALFAPGHTTEMTNYLVGSEALMTGDTLFVESVGRTELEFAGQGAREGARQLFDTIHGTILSKHDGTKVLPAHFSLTNDGEAVDVTPGEPMYSTVGYLRRNNGVLEKDREAFVDHVFENLPAKPPNYETVIDGNLGRTVIGDEATAIELGPNRCAATQDSMVSDD